MQTWEIAGEFRKSLSAVMCVALSLFSYIFKWSLIPIKLWKDGFVVYAFYEANK